MTTSKLAVVSVIRNEIDIIRPFLSHLAALFDIALLLDHRSVDGTAALLSAACEARPAWQCWTVDCAGHHQARVTGFAARHLFETTDADIVFFLDADEFLDIADRSALAAMIVALDARSAPTFRWLNAVPDGLRSLCVEFGDALWVREDAEAFVKVAIPRALYEASGGTARPSSGAHTVETNDGEPISYRPAGHILHLPFRSLDQARRKILAGSMAALARRDRLSHESTHWLGGLARLADAGIGTAEILQLAYRYGHMPEAWTKLGFEDLPALGFTRRTLDVAHESLALPQAGRPPDSWQILAAVVKHSGEQDGSLLAFRLDGDVLRVEPRPAPVRAVAIEAAVGDGAFQARLAALEARLAQAQSEAARARDDVRIVRASTSYRITAPLRAAMRAARGLRGPEPMPLPQADVTVVVTSCGRHDLLAQTLASFRAHNTDARVGEILVVEDGPADPSAICAAHGARLLRTGGRVGQVIAIDTAYAEVRTSFVFHLEDDWEFYRSGFIEPSREILRADPSAIVVGLRAWNDLNDQPLGFMSPDRRFGVLAPGFRQIWHGFSWNPGLRRMADYRRLGRYGDHVEAPPDIEGQDRGGAEAGIGAIYHKLGYRAVVLDEGGYVRHLGWGRTVPWHG